MSYIPDCRKDETYNQKYLNEKNKREIKGYDWCAEEVVDTFFDNLDTYIDEDLLKILESELPEEDREEYEWVREYGEPEKRTVRTLADLIRSKIQEFIENERDELIVSMIDCMDDTEYDRIKEQVDGRVEEEK